MICMTGSAGSGKSAIAQTICERCEQQGILGASFFFSVADQTRNHPGRLVASLAYQLAVSIPAVRSYILAAVQRDPGIFRKSLHAQLDILIIQPVLDSLSSSPSPSHARCPHAIVIDGLDETGKEESQRQVILVLDRLQNTAALPFVVFLTSRPEVAIRDALEHSGCLHHAVYHLVLNDYDAFEDIVGYLRRQLALVAQKRGLTNWPNSEDVDILAREASGHFIYAVTALKFIGERRASPVKRLKIVLDDGGDGSRHCNLYAPIDALYMTILKTAKNAYDSALGTTDSDFAIRLRTTVYIISEVETGPNPSCTHDIDSILRLEPGDTISLLMDLHALFQVCRLEERDSKTVLPDESSPDYFFNEWHKSFPDFLANPTRCGDLYVPDVVLYSHLVACVFEDLDLTLIDGERAGHHCCTLGLMMTSS